MYLIKASEHLRIPFQDIKEATKNFTTLIGRGGYGPVYRGELSLSGEHMVVAVKRLQTDYGQGIKEFLTEIQLLSRYKHQNLVALVGFCEERNEKFLIYEYAEHGSLDSYLKPKKTRCTLSWRQRIQICVDAAHGLDHLHNHVAPNQRVIHRDIKSANILLGHNWKAMISDFGLSKIGRANENDTYLITNASGTYGYCDPAYIQTGILTKESDIYSFGVVLLEVLCGRLCIINVNSKERFLVPLTQRYYKEGKLNLVIDGDLKNYTNSDSMKVFMEIAFQCLHDDREHRPSMGLVLQKLKKALKLLEIEESPELLELEEALELNKLVETMQMQQFEEVQIQEIEEGLGLQKLVETLQQHEYEEALKLHEAQELQKLVETLDLEIGESQIDYEVIKAIYYMPEAPLSCIEREKVYSYLSHGILVDEGKVWLSIDVDGKTQEMISSIKVLPEDEFYSALSDPESRFSKIARLSFQEGIQVNIRTQFLSSDVTYAAYLVCKPSYGFGVTNFSQDKLIYTLKDKRKTYASYPSKMEDKEWWMFELFQTISFKRDVDFEVTLRCFSIEFEAIQFLPIQKSEEDDEIENLEVSNLSTSNIEWDNRLPSDYKQFIYYSNNEMRKKPQRDVIFPTKEEAYSILSSGILIKVNHSLNMWFWITRLNGKKCFILSPSLLSKTMRGGRVNLSKIKRIPSNTSRVGIVLLRVSNSYSVSMRFEVPHGLLSTNMTYGCYLVFKAPQDSFLSDAIIVKIYDGVGDVYEDRKFMYVRIPQRPVIGPDGQSGSLNPMNKLKTIQLPKKRKDGWFEVKLDSRSDTQWMSSSDPPWMNMQQDRSFDHHWRRKRPWKSFFLPCTSYNESGNEFAKSAYDDVSPNSFTLDPHRFSIINIYVWPPYHYPDDPYDTHELIVQGIEFRPV